MNKIKDLTRPLIFVGLTMLFSLLLSYIPKTTKIMDYKIEQVDMLMDIKPDSVLELEFNVEPEMELK